MKIYKIYAKMIENVEENELNFYFFFRITIEEDENENFSNYRHILVHNRISSWILYSK